jgi:hypothetical protein
MVVGRDVAGGGRDLPSLILFVFIDNAEDLKVPRRVFKTSGILRKGTLTESENISRKISRTGERK